MRTGFGGCVVLLGLAVLGVACAKAPDAPPASASEPTREAALPAHPFPRWVSEIEIGWSDRATVTARFGDPDEIEDGVRGGQTWRYRFEEVLWPDDDPERPVVGADGRLEARPQTRLDRWRAASHKAAIWIDEVFYYPGRQPRPPKQRTLPAKQHHLEVVFDPDGRVRQTRYVPRLGTTRIPAAR